MSRYIISLTFPQSLSLSLSLIRSRARSTWFHSLLPLLSIALPPPRSQTTTSTESSGARACVPTPCMHGLSDVSSCHPPLRHASYAPRPILIDLEAPTE
eukprot:9500984-Pyramimonas_sp.AAC.1